MPVHVFGNSGSRKSTYAKALAARERLPRLDLDTIVWEPNQIAVMRPGRWVADYYQRHDQWSYAAHRRIFDAHRGPKVEHTSGPVRVS